MRSIEMGRLIHTAKKDAARNIACAAIVMGTSLLPSDVHAEMQNPTNTPVRQPTSQLELKTVDASKNAILLKSMETNQLLTDEQKLALKLALTLSATGYLLMTNAQRGHQMESASKLDRRQSKIGYTLHAAGVTLLTATSWTMIDKI